MRCLHQLLSINEMENKSNKFKKLIQDLRELFEDKKPSTYDEAKAKLEALRKKLEQK